MPFRPQHSLLRVEVPALHTIDTASVENLFGMWSLFSKTSHAMEDGKRLENLSWRLWNRETFCCHPESKARSTSAPQITLSRQPKAATADIPMPALSSSLDSALSDGFSDSEATATPATAASIPKAHPELRRADSCESRGREKHITPIDLEKIVISIKETSKLDLIDLPVPATSTPAETPSTSASQNLSSAQRDSASTSTSTTAPAVDVITSSQATLLESSTSTVDINDDKDSQIVGSESSSNTAMSTHSHAISYGLAPSSYRSQTRLAPQSATPLKASPLQAQPKKKAAMFTIGTSSGEDESSVESYMAKNTLAENIKRSNLVPGSSSRGKQTSFNNEVSVGRAAEHSPVFDSDDEDDGVSESAIEDDDDDSSDWEDSDDPSGPSSINERELFQRVDSRPNLKSQRSLLTTALHEPDRARALANAASRSTPAIRRSRQSTPNGPSVATSPVHAQAEMLSHEVSLPKPIIMTTSNTVPHQLASSPRTTRRNMLSSELTESLRKNLLWERQHRSTGNLAAMKKRFTPAPVESRSLRQAPEQPPSTGRAPPAGWSNDYFHAGLGEYHAKGW